MASTLRASTFAAAAAAARASPAPPASPLPPATYVYRFTSHDVRPWNIAESIRRSRAAVTRAGGTLDGGVAAPPPHTRRWCVLRSPHVDKKSREHFVRVQHVRSYRWSLPAETVRGGGRPGGVAGEIARRLPANVAVKVTERVGGVAALGSVWAMFGGRSELAGGGGAAPSEAQPSAATVDEPVGASPSERVPVATSTP